MAKTIKNNIRLGAFVVTAVALFIVGVYSIGNRQNLFGASFHLRAQFSNVGGLQPGNNVRYAGINVGSVINMEFINDTTLQVNMRFDDEVRSIIKKDAVASIGSDGLVGNVIVNITPGNGDAPLAESGDLLASYRRTDTDDLLSTLGNTNENIAILSLNLLEITDKLNSGQGTLPRLINDPAMATDISTTLRNLRLATDNLLSMSTQLQTTLDQVAAGQGNLGYLLTDTTLSGQVEMLTSRLDTILVARTEPVLADLQRTGTDLAASSAELRTALETLNQGDGLANALLRDTAATNDLREILENLNEGTLRFSEDMEALQHNFLFRRYFKKLEKERKKQAEGLSR